MEQFANEFERECAELRAANAALRAQVEELKKELAEAKNYVPLEMARLESDLSALADENARLRGILEERDCDMENFYRRNMGRESVPYPRYDALRSRCKAQQDLLAQKSERILEVEAERDEARRQRDEARDEIAAIKKWAWDYGCETCGNDTVNGLANPEACAECVHTDGSGRKDNWTPGWKPALAECGEGSA